VQDEAGLDVDKIAHGRVVTRVLREMQLLSQGAPFPYAREDKIDKLGRIHENVEATIGDQMLPNERRIYANSQFLMICVHVVKDRHPWSYEP
jgi:hypothetical protein